MTSSAPTSRTRSILLVRHTPVTCAPNAFAIWTAKGPTFPDAPLTRTLSPGSMRLPRTAQVLQRQDARLRHGGGLLEAHARWLVGPRLLGRTGVLGEGAVAELGQVPEDLVARPECRHTSADRFDLSGRVQPEATVPWPAESGAHAGEHGPAVQVVEVGLVERCRSEADQDLACLHRRRRDLAQLQDIG